MTYKVALRASSRGIIYKNTLDFSNEYMRDLKHTQYNIYKFDSKDKKWHKI